ncbi:alginate lyase family protein [Paraglaciecola aquimarina]|uniref:Alginate lyase family protein n=1 Tax=Paraglaciecola algarum TaxID=3050085 RepID=A0ABS9D9N3_9ALTE|nr:alginate lyase family protein [Paraglaciecola sp. G1-23]MCF2949097.1 alginate lyase family protein [Paraglaciecola sp. G1-23]
MYVKKNRYLGLILAAWLGFITTACTQPNSNLPVQVLEKHTLPFTVDKNAVLQKADLALTAPVTTVTATSSERSAGGIHDFYSEGDYWWPNPSDPNGPYIRKDGQSNPNNFIDHRLAMMTFRDIVAALTSAYLVTGDTKYSNQALAHINAWFVNPKTNMTPNLLYGQAIKGRHTGRSIGIIDTLHLTEVALSIKRLNDAGVIASQDFSAIQNWFAQYLNWLNNHEFGIKEKHHPNNHGVAWSLQAAAFALVAKDVATLDWIRTQFKQVYLKQMMNQHGGFDAELARTKPYGYSLFVLDLMAGLATLASTEQEDLWDFTLADGRNMQLGMEFILPYIQNKQAWPYQQDIQYWDNWPQRHLNLVLAEENLNLPQIRPIWLNLPAHSDVYEVRRNMPMTQPILWLQK